MRAALIVAVNILLSGCATAPSYLETPLAQRIPASLLTCADAPVAGSVAMQSDVARWVVELDAAGADCRRKVEGINEIVRADGNRGERK